MARTKKNKKNTIKSKNKKKTSKSKNNKKTRKLKLKKLQCGPEGNAKKFTCIRDESICKLKTL